MKRKESIRQKTNKQQQQTEECLFYGLSKVVHFAKATEKEWPERFEKI